MDISTFLVIKLGNPLYGRRPNRVLEIVCFDSKLNRHAIRANVNKPSDVSVCHANDSYKVKSMPEIKLC